MGSAKPNLSIIPPAPLLEVCAALTEGACKYGPWNWRDQQISETIYVDAAIRHGLQYLSGEDIDPDSGLSHITKMIAGLVILRDAQIHKCTIDNRNAASDLQMKFVTEKIAEIHDKYPVDDDPEEEETEEAEAESASLNSRRTKAGGGSFPFDKNVAVGTKVLMSNDAEGKVIDVDANSDYLPVKVGYNVGTDHEKEFWFGPTGYLDNDEYNQYDDVHVVEVLE